MLRLTDNVETDLLGFLHEPPFVATPVILVSLIVHMWSLYPLCNAYNDKKKHILMEFG